MRRLNGSNAGWILALTLAVAQSAAFAQGVTGSALSGMVRDPAGGPSEGSTVELKNPKTGDAFKAVTGPTGEYFIDNIPPGGPYSIVVTSPGYEDVKREGVQLSLGQRLKLDIDLRSMMGEAVEVVSHSDALDDHARTGASSTMKETQIAKLPLQGRNFTDLVARDPRVSGNSIGGQNNRLNNIQIDGGANNDLFGLAGNGTPGGQANAKPLSIEAIKEFVVQIAPFDVRLSNFQGGLVNAITKSGTNEFHGSVFGYLQNRKLSNQHAVINGEYVTDPNFLDYSVYQFGASVGGPIIPNKVHFFLATDLQERQSSGASGGNKYQLTGDPVADKAQTGFTTAEVDRMVNILATKYGLSNVGNATPGSLANPDRNFFAKITASVFENNHLEVSYNFVKARQDNLTLAPTPFVNAATSTLRDGYQLSNSGYGQANTTNTGRVKLTTNFGDGRISNELLAGVSIIRDSRQLPINAPLIMVKAGTLNASPAWISAGGERFSQSNVLDQDVYQLQDNVSFTLGTHRLVAGTSNEFLKIRNVFLQAAIGAWAFDSLDALDAGTASAFQRRFGVTTEQDPGTAKFTAGELGAYLQDEWSPVRNLTVTPGVRVDLPLLSKAVTNPTVLASTALPIDTGAVPSGNPLFSPRLGFNWDVDGSNDTIVRGGVGIFTGRPAYVWVSNAYTVNGISQVELRCTGAGVPKFTADPSAQPSACVTGGPPVPPAGEIDYFDPATRFPQNGRIALGVDRRLPFGVVSNFDFLYTRDVNAWYTTDENLSYQGTSGEGRTLYGSFNTATGRSTPSRLDTTNLTNAVKVFNKSGGHVTSGTIQLQKQWAQLYQVSVGYTYARSFDRISFTSSQALSNFQFAPLDGDIANRSVRPSAFDRPHKITITGTAALPYGFGVGLAYTGQSGAPYTWTVAGDVNGDGQGSNDLVYVPASANDITLKDPTGKQTAAQLYGALSSFIDSQDCLRNAKGGFIQRGACRNPWQSFLDTRLTWTSPAIKGEQRIEVQYDIFNVLNLVNRNWGLFDQVAGFENGPPGFLSPVGYDRTNNRPVYNFVAPTSVQSTIYSPTASRWRMQFGARYIF